MARDVAQAVRSDTASVLDDGNGRTTIREQLARDVDEFVARGGNIEQVPRSYRADPPKKPENNYGRGAI